MFAPPKGSTPSSTPPDLDAIQGMIREEIDRDSKYFQFAKAQIEEDRRFYAHLYKYTAGFLALIIVTASYLLYSSVSQMRSDMKASVEAALADVRIELKNRIDTEFKSANISSLVEKAAKDRTDKELTAIIQAEVVAQVEVGIKDKVREASEALIGLKKVAALTGGALIDLDAHSGMLGGSRAVERDQLKLKVLDTLRAIGVDEESVKDVGQKDRIRNISEYVNGILNHATFCNINSSSMDEWIKDRTKVYKAWPPSADAIQALITRYNIRDAFAQKALSEYRYFMENGEPRDIQFWRDRDSWPVQPPLAGVDKKQECGE